MRQRETPPRHGEDASVPPGSAPAPQPRAPRAEPGPAATPPAAGAPSRRPAGRPPALPAWELPEGAKGFQMLRSRGKERERKHPGPAGGPVPRAAAPLGPPPRRRPPLTALRSPRGRKAPSAPAAARPALGWSRGPGVVRHTHGCRDRPQRRGPCQGAPALAQHPGRDSRPPSGARGAPGAGGGHGPGPVSHGPRRGLRDAAHP